MLAAILARGQRLNMTLSLPSPASLPDQKGLANLMQHHGVWKMLGPAAMVHSLA